MERISSRKNEYIRSLRLLCSDGKYRREQGLFVCDGMKLLKEALCFGAEVNSVLWREQAEKMPGLESVRQYTAPEELFEYVSPMKHSPGPVFTVRIPDHTKGEKPRNAIVLEKLQDPGNVGTVIRTANAFGIDAVILTGDCADLYNPKTVRATMGAVFRQKIIQLPLSRLKEFLTDCGLPLYGAALSERAEDVRNVRLSGAAVAVGSEGRGLSREILDMCDREIIIPMRPESESLNAAVAASVLMWEMKRERGK